MTGLDSLGLFLLEIKDQVSKTFLNFKNYVERQFETKIIMIQSDCGIEFQSDCGIDF